MAEAPVANRGRSQTTSKRLHHRIHLPRLPHLTRKKSLPTQSDTILTPSQQEKYMSLRNEWDIIPTDFGKRMIWIDDLAKERGNQYVNNFLEWVEKTRDPLLIQLNEVSNEQFASCLKSVDWIQRNDALGTVNARLWNRYISADPDLFLGRYKGTPLTVRLNGRVLNPPESDWRYYGVSSVNPPTLLGLRYKPSNKKLKPQDFLLITLGNIYSPQQSESGGWDDTGFILLLEVNSSGERGGLYICYSSADPDHDGEFESGEGKERIPTFPGASSPFTLAEVSPADIAKGSSSYVDLEPLQSPLQSKPAIDVVAVSNSKLEVAETGMKGDWSAGNPPIPLFAVDKEEQSSGVGADS